MAKVDASAYADKWSRRLKAATPDIQAGIKRVTQAPGQKAAVQANVMLQNLSARVNDGSWAKAVGAVSLTDWQNAALNKGVQRSSAGVASAHGKVQAMAG